MPVLPSESPECARLPSLTTTVYVPLLGAVTAISAARSPTLDPSCALAGLRSRICGSKLPVASDSCPIRSTMLSPVFAAKVQVSFSPATEMAPSLFPPFESTAWAFAVEGSSMLSAAAMRIGNAPLIHLIQLVSCWGSSPHTPLHRTPSACPAELRTRRRPVACGRRPRSGRTSRAPS